MIAKQNFSRNNAFLNELQLFNYFVKTRLFYVIILYVPNPSILLSIYDVVFVVVLGRNEKLYIVCNFKQATYIRNNHYHIIELVEVFLLLLG